MRKTEEKQLPLTPIWPDHPLGDELRTVSRILEENSKILHLIMADLSDSGEARGAKGMAAGQVLRCAVLKNWQGFSYRELAFHLADSYSMRAFARLPVGWTPSHSCLQENISRLSGRTLKKINEMLLQWAVGQGLEDGSQIRGDSTAIAATMHHPTDSGLLRDSIRVIARLLGKLRGCGRPVRFSNHLRRAKKRHLEISKVRGKERKRERYEDLLKVSRWTLGYAEKALQTAHCNEKTAVLLGELGVFAQRLRRVISQTERRVLQGQKVPASEKLFSIFEAHADIIKKGSRDPVYGHKLFLTCGRSALILDCCVAEGNPSDESNFQPMLERHEQRFGRMPEKAAFDSGFATKKNVEWAKGEAEIRQLGLPRQSWVQIEELVSSAWIYRQLKRFRAGVEGCISFFKRAFGGGRCTWKGRRRFNRYVQLSVLGLNLVVLARLKLKEQAAG